MTAFESIPVDGPPIHYRRIFYVGDDIDFFARLVRGVTTPRCLLTLADPGSPILPQIRACEPDLLILDLTAPWSGGLSLMIAIQSDPTLKESLIFANMGDARLNQDFKIEGTDILGPDMWLVRPYDLAFLQDLIPRLFAQLP